MPKRIRGARAPGPFRFTVGERTIRGVFWNGDGGGARFETDTEIIVFGLELIDLNGTPELCCTTYVRRKRGAHRTSEMSRSVRITPVTKLRSTSALPLRPPIGQNGTRKPAP